MIKSYINSIALGIVFLFFQNICAQSGGDSIDQQEYNKKTTQIRIPDSIDNKNYQYEELYYRYYNSFVNKDQKMATIYANTYVEKAKMESDSIRLAEGYYSLAFVVDVNLANVYLDSIITATKNKMNSKFPSSAYYFKGSIFYKKRAFKKALDNYILANEYARKNYNRDLILDINHDIGLLKDRIGEYEEALKLHKENYKYFEKTITNRANSKRYLNNLFSITTSFYRLRELDSASKYSDLGIKESLTVKNIDLYNCFVMCEGVINYLQKDYKKAIDSITKSVKYFEETDNKPNLAVGYYYLGKINYESNSIGEGIRYLKKLDTVFQQQKDILPETRDGYEVLINHYKETDNKEQQLEYIEKLIEVDSVLNSNYRYLQKKITQSYDTPLLIQEKDEIIDSLEDERIISRYGIILLAIVSMVTGVLLFVNYTKKKKYQRRFESILNQEIPERQTIQIKENNKKETEDIGISETIVQNILISLEDFEERNLFLKPNITTTSLAKQFDTNAKYLSKVINFYKKKSFITYVNDLRIEFAVKQLQTDQKLRNYTIKAIAREIGFNTTEAFSKSFLKKTGIYPSYFIKQLEKQRI